MEQRLNLLMFRKKRNLNQKKVADMVGISLNHYSRIERGLINPSYNLMERFKEKFNLTNEEIYNLFEKC